jgi:hypothetical protein
MKIKKIILALLLLFILITPIFASAGMDIAITYESSIENTQGESIANPFPFSSILLPHYKNGKFMMELRLPLSFGFKEENKDSFANLDLSVFKPIGKLETDTKAQFIAKNISHYLELINYIQYGYDWQDFNIRFGKISNSTIGDGALVYHYRDLSVASYDTRPGLKLKLDGKYFKLDFLGIEAITNDLFAPDFYGGRVYVKPFYFTKTPILNDSELGFTVITYNASLYDKVDDSSAFSNEIYHSVALDLNIPLITVDNYNMIFYYNMINAKNFSTNAGDDIFIAEDSRSISWRAGIKGRYLSALSYNAYFQSYIDKNCEDTDNSLMSDVNQMINKTIFPSLAGNYKIYGETGYYTTNGDEYFIIDSLFNFENNNLINYSVGAKLKSSKSILMLNNINLSVEKSYNSEEGSSTIKESFIEGLYSAKNVAFSIQSDVQYGVNVFNVGLSLKSDDEGKFNPTYKLGFRISLF